MTYDGMIQHPAIGCIFFTHEIQFSEISGSLKLEFASVCSANKHETQSMLSGCNCDSSTRQKMNQCNNSSI